MAGFDGLGNYVLRYTFVTDAANGIKILASRQDQQWVDMAGAFANCLTRDGQGKPSANISWNTKQINNIGAATAATDVPQLQQVQSIAVRGNQNCVVNPAFSVWQRGAPVTPGAAGAYAADHWYLRRLAGAVGGLRATQNISDTGNPYGTSMGFGRANADAQTDTSVIRHVFESIDARKITGYQNNVAGTVTVLSGYLKAGTTLAASTINVGIFSNATSDANPWNAGWFSEVAPLVLSSGTLSTTVYTRFTLVMTTPFTNLATVMVSISLADASGAAGADSLLYVTGMKLEQLSGTSTSVATPFEPPPYEVDFARCQRYYQVVGGGASNTISFTGNQTNTQVFDNTLMLPVPMFRTPTATKNGVWALTSIAAGAPTVVTGNNSSIILRGTANATAWGAILADTTDDNVTLDAELIA